MQDHPSSTELALARHAAVSWIQQAVEQNCTLARSLALASERPWGGKLYAPSTIEAWYYAHRAQGFDALKRRARKDKGSRKALSAGACEAIAKLRRDYPQLKVPVLIRQLVDQGVLSSGSFSLPSVYRFLASQGLDYRTLKRTPTHSLTSGPCKAFECALSNQLWMADLMFGPSIKLSTGPILHSRLFALIDDCSRLVPHAQYYEGEQLRWFLDCLRQALARRGVPDKLYTDRGKIFLSSHLQIVCANLNIRLLHAKPYAAWSRGKIERFFRTLQDDFQARLVLDPVHTLEELNRRLWRWIESEYHQRPHGGLDSQSPAERFAQRSQALRVLDPQTDWERLFLSRATRRVRLDATVSLDGQVWEVPTHLRGQVVELRFDPFDWKRVEIWHQDHLVGLARRCDKHLNSKIYTDRDYERPDHSF
jgi:putative transposase